MTERIFRVLSPPECMRLLASRKQQLPPDGRSVSLDRRLLGKQLEVVLPSEPTYIDSIYWWDKSRELGEWVMEGDSNSACAMISTTFNPNHFVPIENELDCWRLKWQQRLQVRVEAVTPISDGPQISVRRSTLNNIRGAGISPKCKVLVLPNEPDLSGEIVRVVNTNHTNGVAVHLGDPLAGDWNGIVRGRSRAEASARRTQVARIQGNRNGTARITPQVLADYTFMEIKEVLEGIPICGERDYAVESA